MATTRHRLVITGRETQTVEDKERVVLEACTSQAPGMSYCIKGYAFSLVFLQENNSQDHYILNCRLERKS